MWVEQYDIERSAWDFDWELKGKRPPTITVDPPVSETVEFDRTDLEIIMRQAMNPQASMSALAAKMKMKQPTFAYHWREHLMGRGIFKGWNIRWLGTHREPKTGQILTRRSSAAINVVARDLTPVEMMNFRAQLHSIPFLWAEKVGTTVGDVDAETFVPGNQLVDYFDFLGKITTQLDGKVRILMIDQTSVLLHSRSILIFSTSPAVAGSTWAICFWRPSRKRPRTTPSQTENEKATRYMRR